MITFKSIIVVIGVFWVSAAADDGIVLRPGQISKLSSTQYLPIVKCFFVVFGEYTREEASSACEKRNGSLATFSTLSEERAVRRRLDWSSLPGYEEFQNGRFVTISQLWIGAMRSEPFSDVWVWQPNQYQGTHMESTPRWVSDDPYIDTTMVPDSEQDCAVVRQGGWKQLACNGSDGDPTSNLAGALCSIFSRNGPSQETSQTNYCNVPLMPYSTNNLAIPATIRKQYFIIQGNFTWSEAANSCQLKKAHLATSKTAEEFFFIKENVDLKAVGFAVWIGLKRLFPKGIDFAWIDGTWNTYNGFLPGFPGFTDDCVLFHRNNQGTLAWACLPCDSTVSLVNLPMSALCETFSVL